MRGHRRGWLWLAWGGAALTVASAVFTVLQLAGGERGEKPSLADQVALLGLPVATASLLVGLLGLRRPVERDTANLSRGWAGTLAAQVTAAEGWQWRKLLGDDTQRINLTFTLRAAPSRGAQAPDEGRLFDGTPTVPDVAAYYRRTRPRRLVVTGAAGSGKTVLALELMLALLDGRGEDDPVPVRLSLSAWDTHTPLPDLLVRRLVEAYDWPAQMAAELVRHHRVLPVLDGLDEMDPTLPDGSPAPDAPRALAALHALNAYQEGREAGPLVLTCRSAHYDALAARARLTDAARIEIDTVPAADAYTYLLRRTDGPAHWQPVLDALHDDRTGPLATTLSTPWRLCLAATVYARDGDPADLLAHTTPDDLDAHLLARFIPATTALHPGPYTAADTHRWLARLARHLATHPADGAPAGPGTDIALHRLWPMAGATRVRRLDTTLTTLTVLASIVLAGQLTGLGDGIGRACVYAVAAALTAFLTARSRTDRPAADLAVLRTVAGRRHVYRALLTGVLTGAACGAVLWGLLASGRYVTFGRETFPLSDWESVRSFVSTGLWGVFGGAVVGLTRGVVAALRVQPTAAVTPRGIIRGELVLAAAMASVALLAITAGGYQTAIDTEGPTYFRKTTLVSDPAARNGVREINDHLDLDAVAHLMTWALTFGLVAGLVAWLTRSSARRYLVFILCSRRRLPLRLGAFLDHCCDAGLMRVSGSCYQFRHRELQYWLAAHPNPVTGSTDPVGPPAHQA